MIEFFIEGEPAPGGSKTAFVAKRRDGSIVFRHGTNNPVVNVTDAAGKANKAWRAVVAKSALVMMMRTRPFTGPLKVEMIFFLRRPLDHFTAKNRERGILKEDAPIYHTGPPDALKYARSTEDALTGIVWKDDSQNVRICSEKRWCSPTDKPGVILRIAVLDTRPAPAVEKTLL